MEFDQKKCAYIFEHEKITSYFPNEKHLYINCLYLPCSKYEYNKYLSLDRNVSYIKRYSEQRVTKEY